MSLDSRFTLMNGGTMQCVGLACAMVLLLMASSGCGLDGVTGRLVRIDREYYVLKGTDGKEITLHVDHRTRKDQVAPGDDIHAYVTKDGHAEFIQRLEK